MGFVVRNYWAFVLNVAYSVVGNSLTTVPPTFLASRLELSLRNAMEGAASSFVSGNRTRHDSTTVSVNQSVVPCSVHAVAFPHYYRFALCLLASVFYCYGSLRGHMDPLVLIQCWRVVVESVNYELKMRSIIAIVRSRIDHLIIFYPSLNPFTPCHYLCCR